MLKQNCTTCCWSGEWEKVLVGLFGNCNYPDRPDNSGFEGGVYDSYGTACPFYNLPSLAELLPHLPADWLALERQANQRKALEQFVPPGADGVTD